MAITVTATEGGTTGPGITLRVEVLTGAASTQNGGSASSSGGSVGTVSVTTTQTNSRVYGTSVRGTSTVPTENGVTTRIDGFVDSGHGNWFGTWKATSLTGTPGATVFGYTTNAGGGIAGLEILQAGTLAEDSSGPVFASSTSLSALTTASFTPPAGALLVALVAGGGGSGVTTMTVTDSSGLTWTEVVKANGSSDGYAGVWTARVAGGSVNASAAIAGAGVVGAAPGTAFGQSYGFGVYGAGLYTGTLLYEDSVATPSATQVIASLASTTVSNAFTPGSNTLVVVIVGISYSAGLATGPTVTVADSLGTAYAAGPSIYDGAKDGVYFFTHRYTSAPGTVTATATRSNTSQAGIVISPRVVRGALASQATAGTGTASSGVVVTSFNGVITATLAESLVYTAASIGATEASLATVLATVTLAVFNDATDTATIAIGRAPGLTTRPGGQVLGWTAATAATYALAGLEVFGPDPIPATATVAGAGVAGGPAISGGIVQATASIAGAGRAGAPPTFAVTGVLAAGAGVASAPVSGGITFAFGTAVGAGSAGAVPTVVAAASMQGAGTAGAPTIYAARTGTSGAGAASVAAPVLQPPGVAAGAGAIVVAPPAAGAANGTGAAVAQPTIFTLPGTALGTGGATIVATAPVTGTMAGAGVAGALPVHAAAATLLGAGKLATTGIGLPVGAAGSAVGAGTATATPRISLVAALTGVARVIVVPAGGVNTDDTIEPGPCALGMSIGPTTSRAPVTVGTTGPGGSTVGSSKSAMAVGSTVSDRGN